MILKKLVLYNIGPYKEFNQFNLEIQNQKNTILIGGKNGAGKTTFLTSLRLALYGSLTYGYRTNSKEYLSKINSLLNNKAKKDENQKFYIQIDLSLIDNFKRMNISIIRSWSFVEQNLHEKVNVIKENQQLNEVQKDEFFEVLRNSFPPALLELCLFDGEEISKLTNGNILSRYLKDLSTKLFNLDLFFNLEKDLTEYISQKANSESESTLKKKKKEVEKTLNEQKHKLLHITEEIQDLEERQRVIKDKYNSIKRDFTLHGGLVHEERVKIQTEISSLEMERKIMGDQIKQFIAYYLPFFIAKPKLDQLVHQLNSEEEFHTSKIITKKIEELPVNDLLEILNIENNNHNEKQLKKLLINKLTSTDKTNIIHNASKVETQSIYNLYKKINMDYLNSISHLIHKDREYLNKLKVLRKKLRDNDSSSEFSNMIYFMEELTSRISKIEEKINSLQSIKTTLNDKIAMTNESLNKISNQLFNVYKTNASYEETKKAIRVSKKFRENQLRKKISDVEYFSTKMLKQLLRKNLFIKRIIIDYKTFDISILDYEHQKINKNILSAGEKELLVLSIIWGTIKASKKELPFVFDTLLGRLDLSHKKSVITKLIPSFGKQIIILSTDSEINSKFYHLLSGYISNNFTLNYNNSEKKTYIEPHFFNLK